MSALATVAGKSFIGKFTVKRFSDGVFYVTIAYADIGSLASQKCILLMGFIVSFSSSSRQYECKHEFPIDLLYKDVPSL